MYTCVYTRVHMYVCVYVYVYIYIYISPYIYIIPPRRSLEHTFEKTREDFGRGYFEGALLLLLSLLLLLLLLQ